jgi:signal peptidase I
MKKRNPLISALLALINPGAGFVYNGKPKLGITITILHIVIITILFFSGILQSFIYTIVFLILSLLFQITMVVLSAFQAKKVDLVQLTRINRWYIYIILLLLPLIYFELLHIDPTFLPYKSFRHSTTGMEPLIYPGECFIVDMHYYKNVQVVPGDLIVFLAPDKSSLYLKRCVALPGQKLEIRDAVVYVDDKPFMPSLPIMRDTNIILPANYIDKHIVPDSAGNIDQYGPIIIPEYYYFVLGDHRDNSFDSRYFGPVPTVYIYGKPLYIYYSNDISRIGMKIN